MEQTTLPLTAAAVDATPSPKRTSSVALWILRLLVRGGVLPRLLRGKELEDDVRQALSMPDLERVGDVPTVRARLAARLTEAEAAGPHDDGVMFRNVVTLARLFQLAPVERSLLAFVVAMDDEAALKECMKQVGPARDLYRLLAVALDCPRPQIAQALRKSSTLRATRLIDVRPGARFEPPLVLMDGLDDVLLREHPRPSSMVSAFVGRAAPAKLCAADFAHMADSVELVTAVAAGALRRHAKGVNILLHGPSGVGKTELVRVVAKALDAPLYEVSDEDDDGDAVSGRGRLGACALAMRLLARTKRALLVFDEAEDAFPFDSGPMFGPRQRSTPDKSWTHRLLESSRVPTFWITNQIEQIDPATLRRFDLAVEMTPAPRAQRRKLIEARLGQSGVRAEWIDRASTDDRLTPANVDQLSRVARLVGKRAPDRMERALSQVLDASLALAGHAPSPAAPPTPAPYDLRHVNASVDLEALTRSLASSPRGTMCLYGVPGTGKTAFVRHLAERAGKPLIAARASDLLGMYVGQTEQNLARLFRRAARERAILLLDEADSFLQDRARAVRTWEITQVNELLVQMESFDGLFVCATNLLESLDQASLRRFALKLRFDPLKPDQAWSLFAATAPDAAADTRAELARMRELTPGDFAAVVRRLHLVAEPVTARALLAGLREELAVKRTASTAIGFG